MITCNNPKGKDMRNAHIYRKVCTVLTSARASRKQGTPLSHCGFRFQPATPASLGAAKVAAHAWKDIYTMGSKGAQVWVYGSLGRLCTVWLIEEEGAPCEVMT